MRKVSDNELASKYLSLFQSARNRGIPFTLSLKRLRQLLAQERCYYSGVKFVTGSNDLGRSFDRVDSSLGYTDENLVVCTIMLNSAKSNLSMKDFLGIFRGVLKFYTKNNISIPKEFVMKRVTVKSKIKKIKTQQHARTIQLPRSRIAAIANG